MLSKLYLRGLLFFLFAVVSCAPNKSAPNPGTDDCYNRVTQTCNGKFPDKNLGDKVYRDCINGGLDWCDSNEPITNTTLPVLDKNGRFKMVKTID